jgi:hypothetical protein
MLMVFAFLVLVLLAVLAAYLFIKLAFWPRNAARERGNRQADAINVLSWSGLLLTAGVGWLVALTWAYMQPRDASPADATGLVDRIRALESDIQALKAAGA